MKDKNTTISDPQLEQWLQQALPGDKPSPALQEKLQRIPEQFPQATNAVRHESDRESVQKNRWLYPLLATAASVVGILAGSMDLMATMPKHDLLTALLYGSPDLSGIAL